MKNKVSVIDIIATAAKYVAIILLILFLVSKAAQCYELGYAVFATEPIAAAGEGRDITVTVTEGMSVKQIGEMLRKNGLITDSDVFPIQERLSDYHGKIKPGTYTLSTEMTPDEMIEAMASGADSAAESTQ